MELLVASAIGVLTAGGIYLTLRLRTFPVILGVSLLTYAVNVFFVSHPGRLTVGAPPILQDGVDVYADPLPQALVSDSNRNFIRHDRCSGDDRSWRIPWVRR